MAVKGYDIRWEEEARFTQTAREWRAWIVAETTQVSDGPRELCVALPKFQKYQPHPKDPDALGNLFYPKRLSPGSLFWQIEVVWSTDVDVTANPLAMPAVVTRDTEIREVPAIFDVDGNPLLNTAGDLMTDPPATRKVVDLIWSVSKNIPLNLPDWTDTHPGCVNSDSVTLKGRTYGPGILWLEQCTIGADQNVPGAADTISTLRGIPYCTVDLKIRGRLQGWVEYYPNRGWFQLIPKPGLKFPKNATPLYIAYQTGFTKKQLEKQWDKLPAYTRQRCTVGPLGDFPPEPALLDVNGQMIVNPTFSDVVLLAYDGYQKKPFGDLGFLK